MKQWNGLCKKEWKLMSEWFYTSFAVTFLAMLVVGLDLVGVIPGSVFFGLVLIIWIIACLFLPAIYVLNSLSIEWKRADIWLHSPHSIFQLFGVKAFFAAVLSFINFAVPVLIVMAYLNLFDITIASVSVSDLTIALGILLYSIYVSALKIMCVGLLLGVGYRLLKPIIKGFSIPIIIVIFIVGSRIYKVVTESAVYLRGTQVFVIGNVGKAPILIEKGNFYAGPVDPYIYGGDIVINVLLIITLFILSALLFEKKVRL